MDNPTVKDDAQKLSMNNLFLWAAALVKDPGGFFSGMDKTSGYVTPMLYALAWLFLSMAVTIFSSTVLGKSQPMPAGGVMVLLFLLWRLMGSHETYQTAFRCWAFLTPLSVASALLSPVPYLPLLVFAYGVYLLVVASQKAHGLPAVRSWVVWGLLGGAFLLFVFMATLAGRALQRSGFTFEPQAGGQPTLGAPAAAKEGKAPDLQALSAQIQKQMAEQMKQVQENGKK
jgi:hypothetical protein